MTNKYLLLTIGCSSVPSDEEDPAISYKYLVYFAGEKVQLLFVSLAEREWCICLLSNVYVRMSKLSVEYLAGVNF